MQQVVQCKWPVSSWPNNGNGGLKVCMSKIYLFSMIKGTQMVSVYQQLRFTKLDFAFFVLE